MANQKLPGLMFRLVDGNLTPVVTVSSTENLLIIGNALDGPVNTPVVARNLADIGTKFGPLTYTGDYINPQTGVADGAYADNNLVKAVNEALLGGGGSIVCVRVGGNTASVTGAWNSVVNVSAMNPGRIYNSVTMVSSSGTSGYTVTLNQLSGKGGTLQWTFPLTKTLGQFVSTINNDTRNQSVILTIPAVNVATNISTLGVGTIHLSGTTSGTNGTSAPGEDYAGNKTGYYTELTKQYGTFDTLVGATFDVAVLTGIYADDQVSTTAPTTTSVAQDFAEFLYTVSSETNPCKGVIGLRPTGYKSPAELTTYAQTALLSTEAGFYDQPSRWINFGYFMYNGFYYTDPDDGTLQDIGGYLSVVAGPDIIFSNKELGYYIENGAAAYAGMITNLAAQSATTNKVIGTLKILNGNFTKSINEQLNQGIGRNEDTGNAGQSAYVTFKTNNTLNRPIVVSDNTCSSRTSDYRTLQVLRIAQLAATVTKGVMQPFIGEPNNVEARTAMRTQLNSALQRLVDAGALLGGDGNGFKFTISSDPAELLLGQLTITLFIRPALQIKYVKVVVNVTQ